MQTCSGRETNVMKDRESLYFNLSFSVSELSNNGTRFVGERRDTCPKASQGTTKKGRMSLFLFIPEGGGGGTLKQDLTKNVTSTRSVLLRCSQSFRRTKQFVIYRNN